jgi:capsular polysaccharide biosynthesis protein
VKGPTWRVAVDDSDAELTGSAPPLLATGRALAEAVLRTWRIWVGAALVGAVLAVGAVLVLPRPAEASATLLMVSPNAGDEGAMTTDISLLMTRRVAQEVVTELRLKESPEAVLSTVSATPMSDQILTVTVGGPSEAAAVARARSIVKHYLEFRATQLRTITDGLVTGYDARLKALRAQVDQLTQEYGRISTAARVNQVRLNDVITARTTLSSQITDIQQSIEDASLQTDAAVSSTHVIDEPVAVHHGSRRQVVLFAASGALLGAAMALAAVMFSALTTDRLRRRRDVASALGVPVRVGVGRVLPRSRAHATEEAATAWVARRLRGHPVRWTAQRRRRNLEALALGLQAALGPRFRTAPPVRGAAGGHRPPAPGCRPTTLAIAAVDRADTCAVVVRSLAERLAHSDVRVLLVDLTTSGALAGTDVTGLIEGRVDWWSTPAVFRPDGDPVLAAGPRGTDRRPAPSPDDLGDLGTLWEGADVVLALVELDPGIDLDLLGTWASQVVPVVSAGRATGELLAAIAAFVEESGLDMPFGLLEGADRSDRSSGHPEPILQAPVLPERVQSR